MIERFQHTHFAEKEETYHVLSELYHSPELTQRDLSVTLCISLGKVNYVIKELIKKGLITPKTVGNPENNIKKINYILTKKGMNEKVKLTYYFLKKKEIEYETMQKEWEQVQKSHKA